MMHCVVTTATEESVELPETTTTTMTTDGETTSPSTDTPIEIVTLRGPRIGDPRPPAVSNFENG